MNPESDIKLKTARTIKWNLIDKVSSQILYTVTGIILANILTEEDYGLVATIFVFQAFASLFVDSGFSSALIQRKSPTRLDYSSVLWLNLGIAATIYIILWIAAPAISRFFHDPRLIDLSRVMFLTFIINASAIVQTNRLMKQMTVRMIAVSNSVGLIVSSIVGITLAVNGYGAWALVWQSIVLATSKSVVLWATSHWTPLMSFSIDSIRSIFNVGAGVLGSSFLNTVFTNIYPFIIGHFAGMRPLGYFSIADKWSTMGIASLSQVLTSSFLPVLSQFQDDRQRFAHAMAKMHRFTAYLLFPAMGLLALLATPLFHLVFANKWDASIALFQILLCRGIFTVLNSFYNNCIVAMGHARMIVVAEIVKDVTALIGIVVTIPYIGLSTPVDITEGLRILLWGQLAASAATWIVTLAIISHLTGRRLTAFAIDIAPYVAITAVMLAVAWASTIGISHAAASVCCRAILGVTAYLAINALLKSRIQREVLEFAFGRFTSGKDNKINIRK